jgi:ABC-type phosphate transport system substrate-binding protein
MPPGDRSQSRVKRLRVLVVIVGLAFAANLEAQPSTAHGAFKVIVNTKVGGRTLARDVLSQIYLGKVQRWGDGVPIVAVDLSGTSPVRRAFCEEVLGMSVEAVRFFWLQTVSSTGKRPPLTKPSDEDVIAFVASKPGGVGYVSYETSLPETVREVTVH